MNKPDKGHKGGSCNRTACQAPGAWWYHHDTHAFYCRHCARELNKMHAEDALRIYGHDLLTDAAPIALVVVHGFDTTALTMRMTSFAGSDGAAVTAKVLHVGTLGVNGPPVLALNIVRSGGIRYE